jgi:hypothetical protein
VTINGGYLIHHAGADVNILLALCWGEYVVEKEGALHPLELFPHHRGRVIVEHHLPVGEAE